MTDVHKKNADLEERLRKYQEMNDQKTRDGFENFEKKENQLNSRIKETHKDVEKLWKSFKGDHQNKHDKFMSNKQGGDANTKEKVDGMVKKM
jgi:hypothetical protein